jgi:hypothetical protein
MMRPDSTTFSLSLRTLHRIALLQCVVLGTLSPAMGATPTPQKPTPPIDGARYRTSLQKLETVLRAPSPRIADLKKAMPRAGAVRRADGQTQRVGNEQFQDALSKARAGRLPKRNTTALKAVVAARIAFRGTGQLS